MQNVGVQFIENNRLDQRKKFSISRRALASELGQKLARDRNHLTRRVRRGLETIQAGQNAGSEGVADDPVQELEFILKMSVKRRPIHRRFRRNVLHRDGAELLSVHQFVKRPGQQDPGALRSGI